MRMILLCSYNVTMQLKLLVIYRIPSIVLLNGGQKGDSNSPLPKKGIQLYLEKASMKLATTLYSKLLVQITKTTLLGLNFNSRWISHIYQLKKKCFQQLNIPKVLNDSSWNSDRICLLRLYICNILVLLDYGIITCTVVSNNSLNK